MISQGTWTKTPLSSLMLGLFCLLIAVGILISVFFQAPVAKNLELNRLRTLFSPEDLSQIRSLTLTNRLGTYTFEHQAEQRSWRMTEPRSVMANPIPLERTLEALQGIRIRRIYDSDPINSSNYSLDNPQIRVNILGQNLQERELIFGLVNPVDNSTYVKFTDGDLIYHIDALNFSIGSLDLLNFIDTRVFNIAISDVESLTIRRDRENQTPHLAIRREQDAWLDSTDRLLDAKEVESFLRQMIELKSVFIIDQTTEKLQQAIEEQFKRPAFFVELMTTQGSRFTYTISSIVNTLPDLKIEKRQNFLIQASHRDYPFLIEKDHLELFNRRQNQLPGSAIKKLFY